MCEIDLDPCEVFVPRVVTAKKEHRCGCCAGSIRPGERYHKTFAIFEGDASTHKHCARCERDMAAFAKAHDGARITPDGFDYLLEECIYEGDDTARRWKAMRDRIKARAALGTTPSPKATDPSRPEGPTPLARSRLEGTTARREDDPGKASP